MNCRNSSTPNLRRTWAWLKTGLLGAALALFGTAATAQVASYAFTQTAGTYTPNVGGTQIVPAGTDDAVSSATNIGFNFTFNGTVFTQFVEIGRAHV